MERGVLRGNPEHMIEEFKKFYETSEEGEGQIIEYVYKGKKGKICIKNPKSNLAVGSLQILIEK